MPTLYPQLRDIRWGPDFCNTFDVLRNPVRVPGGNPVLVYRHGGSSTLRDKRLPWIANGNGNTIANHLMGRNDPAFDVISIGTRQAAFDSPNTTHPKNDDYGWQNPLLSRSLYWPHLANEMKLGILAIKSRSEELNINPDKIIAMGTSVGAGICMQLGLTAPLYSNDMSAAVASRYGILGGYDSTVAGIMPHEPLIDMRNSFQETTRTMLVSNLTYTDSTRKLALSAGFTYFDQVAASGVVTVVSGTGATAGTYGVDYVDQAGGYIILERSIGAGADGQTDILINYTGYPQTISLSSCTWDSATKTLTKADSFKTFGHVGKPLLVTAGTGATQGVYTIASRVSKDAITLATSPGANAADYTVLSSGDAGYYTWFKELFGVHTNEQWDKLPRAMKRSYSVLHYIENGKTDWWVPMLFIAEQTGTGDKPYGAPATNQDPHDSDQIATVLAAGYKRGLDIDGFVMPGTWDDGDANVQLENVKIFRWMKRVVNTAKPRRYKAISPVNEVGGSSGVR